MDVYLVDDGSFNWKKVEMSHPRCTFQNTLSSRLMMVTYSRKMVLDITITTAVEGKPVKAEGNRKYWLMRITREELGIKPVAVEDASKYQELTVSWILHLAHFICIYVDVDGTVNIHMYDINGL